MSKYEQIMEALQVLKPDGKYNISISDFENPEKFFDVIKHVYTKYGVMLKTPLGVRDIIVHPYRYGTIRMWNSDVFDQATRREVLLSGNFGTLFGAIVRMSNLISENEIYIILENDQLLKIIIDDIK